MKSDLSPVVVEQQVMDSSPNYLEAIENFQENSEGISEILEKFIVYVAKTGDIMAPWEKVQKIFIKKMKTVIDDFFATNPYTAGNVNPNCENDKFEEMRERLIQIAGEFETPPFTFQRLCELVSSPKKGYTKCEKFMRAIEKNLLVVSSWTYPSRRSGENVEQVNGIEIRSSFNNIERPWSNLPPSPMTTSAPTLPDLKASPTEDKTSSDINTTTQTDVTTKEKTPTDASTPKECESALKEGEINLHSNVMSADSNTTKTATELSNEKTKTVGNSSTEQLGRGDAPVLSDINKETFTHGNISLSNPQKSEDKEEKREPLPGVGTLVEKHSIKSLEVTPNEPPKQCIDIVTPELSTSVSMETETSSTVPQSPKRKHSDVEEIAMETNSPTKRAKQDPESKSDVVMDSCASESNS